MYNRFPEVFANFTVLNLVRAGYRPHINPQKMIPFPLFVFTSPIIMGYKPLTNRKETSPGKRRAVWTRHLDGHSVLTIMRLENLPRSTVRSIIERAKLCSSDSFKSRPRSGAHKITTNRDDRALLRAANKDTKASMAAGW
jgi:hypothetical protein